ncbi:MAG: hypothetical protein GX139_09100 [Armatimonadetes bacterium]|jgi:hypothetical protein|nr:hypothetical protein [Armatimonadota bacterium]
MSKRIILGVNISSRTQAVPEVQKALTKYGCNIRTRLGLHEVSGDSCAPGGLLILEMFGDDKSIGEMMARCRQFKAWKCRK